jgi:hypothetical protein
MHVRRVTSVAGVLLYPPYSCLRDTKFSASPVAGFPRAPTKLVETRSTASSSVDGRSVDFHLQMQSVSWNCKYHFRIDLPLGVSAPYFVRKCRWMLTTDLFTWKSRTQNALCSQLVVAIFLSCLLVDDSGISAGKINFENLPSKARISQRDTLFRFRIINYWNLEHLFDLLCMLHCQRTGSSQIRLVWLLICIYSSFVIAV